MVLFLHLKMVLKKEDEAVGDEFLLLMTKFDNLELLRIFLLIIE